MRMYIFTDRERRLLKRWIEKDEEVDDLPRILSWIRQNFPTLAEDMDLLFDTIGKMQKHHRWRRYMTRRSEFGSALRRAESALTRLRRDAAT